MKKHILIFTLALLAAGCGNNGDAPTSANTADTNGDDGTAVAIVNGASIPESRLASYASAAQVAGGLQGEQRLAIIENMINSELISQQAQKDGMREIVARATHHRRTNRFGARIHYPIFGR